MPAHPPPREVPLLKLLGQSCRGKPKAALAGAGPAVAADGTWALPAGVLKGGTTVQVVLTWASLPVRVKAGRGGESDCGGAVVTAVGARGMEGEPSMCLHNVPPSKGAAVVVLESGLLGQREGDPLLNRSVVNGRDCDGLVIVALRDIREEASGERGLADATESGRAVGMQPRTRAMTRGQGASRASRGTAAAAKGWSGGGS